MKSIGCFVGIAVAAFTVATAQAVELVAEWTDFTGLTTDTPLKPSRGVEAGEGGVWTLSLNGGSVQGGALFTGIGLAPTINILNHQHQVGGHSKGGFSVVLQIEPAEDFVAGKPIWMFHEYNANTGGNGQGIALTSADAIRGIWTNAIWDNSGFPATDVTFTRPSTVVTTCGSSGTQVYWNGASAISCSGLAGKDMGNDNEVILLGNFYKAESGGNNFKISRIAVFDGILSKYLVENDPWMENTVSINVANGQTYSVPDSPVSAYDVQVAAGGTLQFEAANLSTTTASISATINPSFNAQGTIKIANASNLQPGNYLLMDWKEWSDWESIGYGKPQLVLEGYNGDLTRVRLVPEAFKLWLQIISDEQAARPTLTILPLGDSITEGLNGTGTSGRNYRMPLINKLSLAGYNVATVGYWAHNGSIDGKVYDPSGSQIDNPNWVYHCGKGSMRAFKSSPNGAAMYDQFLNSIDIGGEPDVVLMHIGINDMIGGTPNDPDGSQTAQAIIDMATKALASFPNIKFVMSSPMCNEYGHSYQNKATEDATSGNDYNKTFVTPIHTKVKEFYDAHKDDAEFAGRLFFADMYENVMPRWYAYQEPTHLNSGGSDHCHPNWNGHDKMAETWLQQIKAAFPDPNPTGGFNSSREKATYTAEGEDANLGAAANVDPSYLDGFRLVRVIEPGANQHFSTTATRDEIYATISDIVPYTTRIAYYVEFVRDTSTAKVHRWVWADMDTFASTIDGCGLPNKATVQQVVNNLHIDTNHPAVEKIPATTEGEQGFIEFTPSKYSGTKSTVSGAPTEWFETRCGYNDTMESTGDNDPRACMQLHRIFKADDQALQGGRQGQVVFAYNNWGDTGNAAAEFGIGTFDQTFTTRSCDWTYMTGFPKVNATSMSVRRIEIWAYAPHRAPKLLVK